MPRVYFRTTATAAFQVALTVALPVPFGIVAQTHVWMTLRMTRQIAWEIAENTIMTVAFRTAPGTVPGATPMVTRAAIQTRSYPVT
jgi:hypothetical protein